MFKLMIKTHLVTGLKYLCITKRKTTKNTWDLVHIGQTI